MHFAGCSTIIFEHYAERQLSENSEVLLTVNNKPSFRKYCKLILIQKMNYMLIYWFGQGMIY